MAFFKGGSGGFFAASGNRSTAPGGWPGWRWAIGDRKNKPGIRVASQVHLNPEYGRVYISWQGSWLKGQDSPHQRRQMSEKLHRIIE